MNKITLHPNGEIQHNGQEIAADPLRYLNYEVSLTDGFTIRSYFNMLAHYSIYTRLNEFFHVIRDSFDHCPDSGCVHDDIRQLEFAKTVEMIGFPNEPRLEIYNALKGINGEKRMEIRPIPMTQLVDIPMSLGNLKHVIFGDTVDVFEFETVFSLYEFIDGIAWELSFQTTTDGCTIRP